MTAEANTKSGAVSAMGAEWPMLEALMGGTAAMRKAGRPVETRILKDRGHEFDGRTFDAWAAIDAMGEWILKQRS